MITAKALVLCLADPTAAPRPRRIIALLASRGFQLAIASYQTEARAPAAEYITIPNIAAARGKAALRSRGVGLLLLVAVKLLRSRQLVQFLLATRYRLKNVSRTLQGTQFDIIVVENPELLPFALEHKGSAKILLDVREFYPQQFQCNWKFRVFHKPVAEFLCSRFLKESDMLMTVSEGLRREFQSRFGLEMVVVRSVPNYVELPANPVAPEKLRIVHHGYATEDRKLENMIELAEHLDSRFTLDFYLVGDPRLLERLRQFASGNKKVNFRAPLQPAEIIPTLNGFDIGLYLLEPTSRNTRFSLPNKLFEFIQARLAVAIGPSPDMARIVEQYGCGIVAPDFDPCSLAAALNRLGVGEIMKMKTQSVVAARELCFEKEQKKLSSFLYLEK